MSVVSVELRRALSRSVVALGIAAMPAIGLAQTAPADRGRDPIVVQAERLSRAVARERAVGFVRLTGVAAGDTPAARWIDPICPSVVGLVDSGARRAEAMIRRVAEAVGAPVAPEGCERNIVVTFTPDGAALAREIAQRQPRRMAQVSPSTREELTTGSAPVRWWYTTDTRSRHNTGGGDGVAGAGGTDQSNQGSGYGQRLGGNGGGLMHYESSVVSTLTQRVLTSAIVIVDEDSVMGMRLDSIAAYAALVALAELRGSGASPEGSILNMFGSANNPRHLTTQDMAFLQALYRLNLDRQAMQHRGALIGQITEALTATN